MAQGKFQKKLISWFLKNRRSLPWRKTENWYYIWVSEIMLQQTQVDQVIPYYLRFINNFNTLRKLASASQKSVLKSWEGLGYYSRARHLHESAKIIVNEFNGQLPTEKKVLEKLPGFGPYTTNAVLSLAFNKPYAVVDGNVKRVISRLYGIHDDMRKTATHKKIQTLMDQILPPENSRQFNEALMELGALVCLPANPQCQTCPLTTDCLAKQKGLQTQLPFSSPKPKIPRIHAVAFIVKNGTRFLLMQRPAGGMLAGLWEFPTIRIPGTSIVKKTAEKRLQKQYGLQARMVRMWPEINHSYTHFHLKLRAVLLVTGERQVKLDGYSTSRWLLLDAIREFPLHRAMHKLISIAEKDLITVSD